MFKIVGSNPFLKKGKSLSLRGSYNEPTIGIYVIAIRIINKQSHILNYKYECIQCRLFITNKIFVIYFIY